MDKKQEKMICCHKESDFKYKHADLKVTCRLKVKEEKKIYYANTSQRRLG